MLNVILTNKKPISCSKVSGIPTDWSRSDYNSISKQKKAFSAMKELLHESFKKCKFILLSYNNEGIIQTKEWEELFQPYTVKKYEIPYGAYKASRNLKKRNKKEPICSIYYFKYAN